MDVNQAGMDRGELGNRPTGSDNVPSGGVSDLTGQAKQAVTQTAQETVETAKTAGMEIADTVQEQVAQVVDQAVTQTADTVAQVKEQASSVFIDQRDRAIAGLSGLADALRETGRTLTKQAENADGTQAATSAIAPFVDEIADRLSHSADFLKEKDVQQLISEAENLARKQPVLFVGALFGIGVVGARLLKGTLGSSNDQPSQSGQNTQESGWNAGTGWATPEQSDDQSSPDAMTFSSQLAANLASGRGAGTYETGLNSDRSSVYGSSAPSTTGTSS